jgi:cell division protein FtsL
LAVTLFLIPKSNFLILILGTIASIAVYVILLYYTGYVTQEDINILKTARAQS